MYYIVKLSGVEANILHFYVITMLSLLTILLIGTLSSKLKKYTKNTGYTKAIGICCSLGLIVLLFIGCYRYLYVPSPIYGLRHTEKRVNKVDLENISLEDIPLVDFTSYSTLQLDGKDYVKVTLTEEQVNYMRNLDKEPLRKCLQLRKQADSNIFHGDPIESDILHQLEQGIITAD